MARERDGCAAAGREGGGVSRVCDIFLSLEIGGALWVPAGGSKPSGHTFPTISEPAQPRRRRCRNAVSRAACGHSRSRTFRVLRCSSPSIGTNGGLCSASRRSTTIIIANTYKSCPKTPFLAWRQTGHGALQRASVSFHRTRTARTRKSCRGRLRGGANAAAVRLGPRRRRRRRNIPGHKSSTLPQNDGLQSEELARHNLVELPPHTIYYPLPWCSTMV